jgi:general secretion pathway protein G
MQAKRGFTLVEILIVVVILGILAAIVIPQFTQASTEAKTNSLCSDLQSLRSQVELYKVQHNDLVPLPEAAGTWNRMIYATDIDGATAAAPSKERDPANDIIYGPYLERVPANPFNDLNTIKEVAAKAAADNLTGWCIVTDTGEVYANDDGVMADGVTNHSDL